jgi:hypothetical protein
MYREEEEEAEKPTPLVLPEVEEELDNERVEVDTASALGAESSHVAVPADGSATEEDAEAESIGILFARASAFAPRFVRSFLPIGG